MRIVIDMQGAQTDSRFRGIGRYTMALVDAMVRYNPGHEIWLVLNGMLHDSIEGIRASFEDLLPQEHILVWYSCEPVPHLDPAYTGLRHAAEDIRESFISSLRPDVVVITSLFEGFGDNSVQTVGRLPSGPPIAVIQYDLIPLLNAEQYFKNNERYEVCYREKVSDLVRADLLLCISESARQESIEHLEFPADKAVNIGAAADDVFRPVKLEQSDHRALMQKFAITGSFIMYSGATDDRKNHLRLFSAYAGLPKEIRASHQLVIAGIIPLQNRRKFEEYVRHLGLLPGEVIITGQVSDVEMLHLYNSARLYVFPSWHEGFGLPLLEAMACGTPSIGSNTTSMPEILGRGDTQFDPFDIDAIRNKIVHVLSDEKFQREISQHGLKQARKFSWSASARKTFSALESLHSQAIKAGTSGNSLPSLPTLLENLMHRVLATPELPHSDALLIDVAQVIAKTFPSLKSRQLLIDVSELVNVDARTGVQRVVRSLLKRFLESPPEGYIVRPVYARHTGYGYRYADRFTDRFLGKPARPNEDEQIEIANGDIFFGLDLQHHVVIRHGDMYQEWRQAGVMVVFLLHDLLPVLIPNAFRQEMYDLHRHWLEILAKSDGVIAVSNAVMLEFRDWLESFAPERKRKLRLGWSHSGSNMEDSMPSTGFRVEDDQQLANLPKGITFLVVGTLEPRKGHDQVLEAFENLWNENQTVNLILVGKIGWHVEALVSRIRSHKRFQKSLIWFDGVSDEFLERIYRQSDCLIASSLGEGFGLPLVEAATHGIPIIARDLPVFREVAGDNAFYFEGNQPAALEKAIVSWIKLKATDQVPDSTAILRVTWEESYNKICEILIKGQWQSTWFYRAHGAAPT